MRTSEWAATIAKEYLAPLGDRWRHSVGVAEKARSVAYILDEPCARDLLVAAAYVHDIGYAPALASTGCHPLDGARFMQDRGHSRLACLVAHHTGSDVEVRLRGLADELAPFINERSDVAAALTYADLMVGPQGQGMTPDKRRAEIAARYGSSDVVTRAIEEAWPELMREVHLVEGRLATVAPG